MSDKQPTPGMRAHVSLETVGHGTSDWTVSLFTGDYSSEEQANANAAYINGLIEADERRKAYLVRKATAPEGQHDLMVDLGDMTRSSLNQIALDAEYEAMVEDIIGNVNHIVLQGVPPIRAVFAMSQAFAIVLGYALRANMNFDVAKAMITQVMKSATKNEQLLRIITKQ
jgi:hypothetical protein